LKNFALYCKSYKKDVFRVKELLQSIEKYNTNNIPLFISTPEEDELLFKNHLGSDRYTWIRDEAIIESNPHADSEVIKKFSGSLAQQVIKSEFWRLELCKNYLCLDSDAKFIREFSESDFFYKDGTPFTVAHTADDFIAEVKKEGRGYILRNMEQECRKLMSFFNREGTEYDFGPAPFIWSSEVWAWLADYLWDTHQMTIWDAIALHSTEMRWYGEALMFSKAIKLQPISPLFKVYHYEWQFKNDKLKKITESELSQKYIGVIHQSNWDKKLEPKEFQKPFLSRCWRFIKENCLKK
jgi:hypothetical protein